MVLYFTGTGNSRYVAELLSEKLADSCVSINEMMRKGAPESVSSELPYVIVAPTYSWQLPHVVRDFLKALRLDGSKKVYFVLTCGSDVGNSEKYVKRLCREKELEFMGLKPVIMPENYIVMFNSPSEEDAERMVRASARAIAQAADTIGRGQRFETTRISFSDRIKSSIVNALFYKFAAKADEFYATDGCIGCKKCEELCPLGNITVKKSPSWGKRCTHCMACICGCPAEAIEYGDKTRGKRRHYIK